MVRDSVTMNVDKQFFDEMFEPARKNVQNQLGLDRLGQKQFTKMLFKSNMKLDLKIKPMGGIDGFKKLRKRKKR